MSGAGGDVGQVIVVLNPAATELDVQQTQSITPRQSNPGSEKKKKRQSVNWELLHKVHSTSAFYSWLKQKEASGIRYFKKKSSTCHQGDKDYYGCTGPGCPVLLEVLFDNASEDVIIYYNGTQHKHGQKPHSGWGLPEKTKKEVQQLYLSGVTTSTEMDARLRQLGHTDYTMKQLTGFMGRLRRSLQHQEVFQEYSSLSVWSGRDRSSELSSKVSDATCYSPPPAADEADFSDPEEEEEADSPVAPHPETAGSRTSGISPGRHRRRPAVMDEGALRRLVDASLAVREHSYSPYSQFPVGAALLCADGQIVTGCNVENASFGLTNCAERTAVFKAVSEGRREFTAVAIAAEMGDKFVGPCGACRQVLAEFNPEMPVILAKPNGHITRTSIKELLPMAFLPDEVPFKKQ